MIQSKLARGVRAPDFVLPLAKGTPTRFYALVGGRPVVLAFVDDADTLDVVRRACESTDVSVYAVVTSATHAVGHANVFTDDGSVARAYGAGSPAAFVLDRNLRVLDVVSPEDLGDRLPEALPDEIEAGGTVRGQAPVLFVPRALPEDVCAFLIDRWHRGGNEETGVERSTEVGRRDELVAEAKRRRDHVVTDDDLVRRLTQTIGRRILPELQKAFAYEATRFEGYKIACYDASSGGFFDAHRDNLSPATAHRRFAMSLNLNGDYEGGELRFPEYGDSVYRPGAGEALIFACSVLHEVVPVTSGRRFTLLSFLFGEDSARARPTRKEAPGFDPFAT